MLMMSSDALLLSGNNNPADWKDKALKLQAELDDIRIKYETLLEASLQQMQRAEEFPPEKKRMSPTGNNTNNLNNSQTITSMDETNNTHHSSKRGTPKSNGNKKRFPFIKVPFDKDPKGRNKGKDKPSLYSIDDDPRAGGDFVLPLSPSTSYQHLPRLQVCPLVSNKNCVIIGGPEGPAGPTMDDEAGGASFMDIVAGRSISTYPHIPGNPTRDGDPIADRFAAQVYENRVIACVADGCNWGNKPKEAAQKANSAFIDYVNRNNAEITDVKKAGEVLLHAFEYAHNCIMEGKQAFWDAGTTTLLGGVLLEINKGTDKWTPQWEFVCASVGDCKAFCFSMSGEITDITQGNRQNASDPRDCGGRLGPHLEEGKPDLRNLNLFCQSCEDGDVIFIVTDGVHDNLDPQHLGKVPRDMRKEFNLSGDRWDDVDPAKAVFAKNAFTTELLNNLLGNSEGQPPAPKLVTDRLVNHCIGVTQKSREYMENNQGKRLPEDYVEFPGKMDHTTCLCFRVGRFPTLPASGVITGSNVQVPSLSMSSSSFFLASTTAGASSSPVPNLSMSSAPNLTGSGGSGSMPRTNSDNDGSPRIGSPTTLGGGFGNTKSGDNWTKISPSIKHS